MNKHNDIRWRRYSPNDDSMLNTFAGKTARVNLHRHEFFIIQLYLTVLSHGIVLCTLPRVVPRRSTTELNGIVLGRALRKTAEFS